MARFEIVTADAALIARLDDLAEEAALAGILNVGHLVASWADGTECYDGEGELFLAARRADAVVGVGGLARCPDVAGALRMRRFYVAEIWRRHGVARALATRLIDHAYGHVDTISCNAQASAAAPIFWEAMGFTPSDHPGITHTLTR